MPTMMNRDCSPLRSLVKDELTLNWSLNICSKTQKFMLHSKDFVRNMWWWGCGVCDAMSLCTIEKCVPLPPVDWDAPKVGYKDGVNVFVSTNISAHQGSLRFSNPYNKYIYKKTYMHMYVKVTSNV